MPLIGAPCWRKSANDGLLQRNGHTDRLLVIHSAVHSQGGHRDTDRRAERSGGATVTPTDARKVLVGLLAALCVLSLASPASGVGRNRPITLTGAQRRAIIRAPHPYLRQHCPARLGVLIAQRTTFGTHRVIVAEADCRYGTTGSPLDIATYARRDGRLRQLYRLYSGRSIHRSRVIISALSFSARHRRVVVRYGGFTRKDPVCCPSRIYHRVFHLYWRRFTEGRLVRDS